MLYLSPYPFGSVYERNLALEGGGVWHIKVCHLSIRATFELKALVKQQVQGSTLISLFFLKTGHRTQKMLSQSQKEGNDHQRLVSSRRDIFTGLVKITPIFLESPHIFFFFQVSFFFFHLFLLVGG